MNDQAKTIEGSTKIFSEGLLLAALPAAGYVITFLYEWGGAQYFRIPYRWITLDLPAMLGVTLLVGGYFIIGVDSIFKIARRMNGYPDVTPHYAWSLGLLGLPLVRAFWPRAFIAGILIVFLIELAYRARAAYQRRKQGIPVSPIVAAVDIPTPIMRRLFLWSVGIGMVWFFAVAGVSGYVHAQAKDEFLILSGPPELVVLATYGDRIVAAPLVRKAKRIEPAFRVFVASEAGLLRREKVGPLSVE